MFSALIDRLQSIIDSSVCHNWDIESYMTCLLDESLKEHFVEMAMELKDEDARRVWVNGDLARGDEPQWFRVFLQQPDCAAVAEHWISVHLPYPYWKFSIKGEEIQLHVVTVVRRRSPQCCLPDPYVLMESDEISCRGDMMPCSECEQFSLLAEGNEAVQKLSWILERATPV